MITKNLTKKFALMIRIIISIMVLIPHTSFAVEQGGVEIVLDSNMQHSEHTTSISGSENCWAPTDLNKPKEGECQVERSKFETGWKLTKVGNSCYLYAIKFISKIKSLQLETGTYRFTVKCPTSQEIDIMKSPLK